MARFTMTQQTDSHQTDRDHFEEESAGIRSSSRLPCRYLPRSPTREYSAGRQLIQDLDNGNERHRKEESDKVHSIKAEPDTCYTRR